MSAEAPRASARRSEDFPPPPPGSPPPWPGPPPHPPAAPPGPADATAPPRGTPPRPPVPPRPAGAPPRPAVPPQPQQPPPAPQESWFAPAPPAFGHGGTTGTDRTDPAGGAPRPRFAWEDWENWDGGRQDGRDGRGRELPRLPLRQRLRRLTPRAVIERLARIRPPVRTAGIAGCLVLGLGLLGGAAAGSWLTGGTGEQTAAVSEFTRARDLWHSVPVDEIFPRSLSGDGAGPGGTDRTWVRIAVAPDGDCAAAFDPLLAKVLSPAGCERLLRATYVDVTSSSVTTVGLVVTRTDRAAMKALHDRFERENLGDRADLIPRPYAAPDTPAEDFGDAQRASWTVRVLPDLPAVVYAVSGFADGRTVSDRLSAEEATADGATAAPAQAGLGHDARGVADRVERGFRDAATEEERG